MIVAAVLLSLIAVWVAFLVVEWATLKLVGVVCWIIGLALR